LKFPRVARLVRLFGVTRAGRLQSMIEKNRACQPDSPLPVVPHERRLAILALLESELVARGIDYRTCLVSTKAYCAVNAAESTRLHYALTALAQSGSAGRLSAWPSAGYHYGSARDLEGLSVSVLEAADSIIVASPFEHGRLRVGRSGGVEVLLLEKLGAGLLARQRRALRVDWTAAFRDNRTPEDASQAPGAAMEVRQHALNGEPVDVVYSWVNSGDPDWIASYDEWAAREDQTLDSASNDLRYLDREELKYSLRSLWLYAPFVRHIYIVTNGQVPAWLNRSDSRIHVVSHKDLFPRAEDLPTFNSHAIEACLHRIPGLAEYFLYFNDDVLLGRETDANTYFTKAGLIKSRFSTTAPIPVARPDRFSTPTEWASYNASQVISRDFGLLFDRKLKHVPMPMKRSLLEEIEARYSAILDATRRSRFRSRTDIALPTMLAHFYGISTRKAVEWEHVPGEYLYADTGRADFDSKLAVAREGDATFLCMNATRFQDISLDQQASMLRSFFEERYPLASPFESSNNGSAMELQRMNSVGQRDN
jgi:hypothetical protein